MKLKGEGERRKGERFGDESPPFLFVFGSARVNQTKVSRTLFFPTYPNLAKFPP